jgi:hypothetical protein
MTRLELKGLRGRKKLSPGELSSAILVLELHMILHFDLCGT